MSFASRFNNGNVFDTKRAIDGVYLTLEELLKGNGDETVYPVTGMFVNKKSKFGDSPVLLIKNETTENKQILLSSMRQEEIAKAENFGEADSFLVNMPNHLLNTIEEIMGDREAVADVKAGKVGVQIYTYKDKTYGRTCYTVEWVDL